MYIANFGIIMLIKQNIMSAGNRIQHNLNLTEKPENGMPREEIDVLTNWESEEELKLSKMEKQLI
jgi:hypothetical protein